MARPALLVVMGLLTALPPFASAREKSRDRTYLAVESSRTLARGEVEVSARYGLQSALLVGQPVGHTFGELKVRAGLLKEKDASQYGLDLFLSIDPIAVDFQTGSMPMVVFGARMQFLRNKGWIPSLSLEAGATFANRYRSVVYLSPSATWSWRGDFAWFRFTLGGQLGLAVNPSPNQSTKGPFLLGDVFVATAIGVWRVEGLMEYGGDFLVGYFAMGARILLWRELALTIGFRVNIVKEKPKEDHALPFGMLSWRF